MAGEHRPRTHPLINPEASAALLRHIVAAWDRDDVTAIKKAIAEARRLLGSRPIRESREEG